MCIYQIMRIETGEKYIGQSVNEVGNRWNRHSDINSKSGSLKLKRCIHKYNKDNFDYSIIEVCETIDQLNEREVHWIKELNTLSPNGYNLNNGGMNKIPSEETRKKMCISRQGRVFSEETKLKMSLSHQNVSEETRKKMSLSQTGKKRSQESIQKMRDAQKNITPETRLKLSRARIGIKFSPESIQKMKLSKNNMTAETKRKMSESRLAVIEKRDEIFPPTTRQLQLREASRKFNEKRKLAQKLAKENNCEFVVLNEFDLGLKKL